METLDLQMIDCSLVEISQAESVELLGGDGVTEAVFLAAGYAWRSYQKYIASGAYNPGAHIG